MAFRLMQDGESDEGALMQRVGAIGDAVREILQEAATREVSPLAAAKQRVGRILGESRSG